MKLLPTRHRRHPFDLQLTAMIDIFSMIVIFLIKGAIFSGADLPVPKEVELPKSVSKEIIETGPHLSIVKNQVKISLSDAPLPLEIFRGGQSDPRLASLRKELQDFVSQLPTATKTSGVILNVVSDRETPYRDIFDAVRFFRTAGFDTLYFVAVAPPEGE